MRLKQNGAVFREISKKNKFRVLWCTTLYEFALSEYKIISEVFLNDKIDLCIRLHPAGHITESEIRSLVPAGKYQISNHSLLEDFSNTATKYGAKAILLSQIGNDFLILFRYTEPFF